MRTHHVRSLLMGGQACVLYGAAEFSRDVDLAVLADRDGLARLDDALTALHATVIAVPPFRADYLERGHAVHFRCGDGPSAGLRVDVMSRMRGVEPFERLWERRTTLVVDDAASSLEIDVLALPDLVAAKKTQRDKDWPMIRRLVEASYFGSRDEPTPARVAFWLAELRTPELLVACARAHPDAAQLSQRPAARAASSGDVAMIEAALLSEETRERELDRAYWAPLRAELEALRREHRAGE